MTHREIVLVEWECDSCHITVIAEEALPLGWEEDLATGDHWCGCARTVDAHILDELMASIPDRPAGPAFLVLPGETLLQSVAMTVANVVEAAR